MSGAGRLTSVVRAVTKSPVALRQSVQPCSWRAGARRGFSTRAAMLEKKYTKDHEWIELDSAGKIGTVGITSYAAKALGDVVYVELPEVGLEVSQGDAMGAVESVKSASDILTPVSGKITGANGALEEKPGNINKDPEGSAWIAKIELSEKGELEGLMTKEDYDNFEKE